MAKEIPGNAMASHQAYIDQLVKNAQYFQRFEKLTAQLFDNDCELVSLTIKLPTEEDGEYLVVVRSFVNGKKMVGFHGANTFMEALRGLITRLENHSIKWRKDKYADD